MSQDVKVLKTLRAMAWERAKGELYSILFTYWGEEETFEEMRKAIDSFTEHVDAQGLVE